MAVKEPPKPNFWKVYSPDGQTVYEGDPVDCKELIAVGYSKEPPTAAPVSAAPTDTTTVEVKSAGYVEAATGEPEVRVRKRG